MGNGWQRTQQPLAYSLDPLNRMHVSLLHIFSDAGIGQNKQPLPSMVKDNQGIGQEKNSVWRIDHFDQQGETLSRFVEITFVPEILKTQAPDAEQGLSRLQAELAARDGS